MSGDWEPIETWTPQEPPSKPFVDESYPMPSTVDRTIVGMSTYPDVVTSPATWTRPVVTMVSTATRLAGSWVRRASRTPSLIWSQILSGWPSVTDSEVKRRYVTSLLSQRLLTDPSRGRRSHVDRSLYRRPGVRLLSRPEHCD